jgi:hypothetical protein
MNAGTRSTRHKRRNLLGIMSGRLQHRRRNLAAIPLAAVVIYWL